MGKSSEAGFGNEMYKVLTGAALSVMLNRSLIIGQTRHIGSFSSLSVIISNMFIFDNSDFCNLRLSVIIFVCCFKGCVMSW